MPEFVKKCHIIGVVDEGHFHEDGGGSCEADDAEPILPIGVQTGARATIDETECGDIICDFNCHLSAEAANNAMEGFGASGGGAAITIEVNFDYGAHI